MVIISSQFVLYKNGCVLRSFSVDKYFCVNSFFGKNLDAS